MSNNGGQSSNSDEFKDQQRQMWDNAAPGWQARQETIERAVQKVSDKIVQLVEIQPGDKVLDIATGIGEPAVTAAKIVMPNGKVVATDISPKMLQIARTRATSFGLNGKMEFRESDGEKIDLPEQTAKFDAIPSR